MSPGTAGRFRNMEAERLALAAHADPFIESARDGRSDGLLESARGGRSNHALTGQRGGAGAVRWRSIGVSALEVNPLSRQCHGNVVMTGLGKVEMSGTLRPPGSRCVMLLRDRLARIALTGASIQRCRFAPTEA